MGHNNGVITETGISINDVATVLGVGSYDVGTLCKHKNVNMWAKWKPFVAPVPGYETIAKNHTACAAANYGLTPFSAGNMPSVVAAWDNNLNGWSYNKPAGGASSPYRLGDFGGYNHRAQPPVSGVVCTENINKSNTSSVLQINFDFESGGDDTLKMSDILNADASKVFYPGVIMIKNGDTSTARVITTNRSINGYSDNMPPIEIAQSNIEEGRWVLYPVYTPNAHTSLTSSSDTFYSMPCVKSVTCNVTNQFDITTILSEIMLTITKVSSTSISYRIYLKAKSSNVNITDLVLYAKKPGATTTSALTTGEKSTTIASSLTISTSGTERTGTITGLGTTVVSPSGVFYISFKYSSNSIVAWGGMDEEAPDE